MADSSGIDVATGTSNLNQTFNENSGDPSVSHDLDTSVGATAQAEIQTIQEAEQALAQHDDRWRQLSDRLSARPQAAPTLDMDGGSQRSIAREYTEHRREWGAQRDAIEIGAIREVIDVRADGTTLTNEFSANAEQDKPAPAPELSSSEQNDAPDNDGESRFQREFAAAAPEISRTNDR